MSKRRKPYKSPESTIHIGGNVNTSGGDIVGGNVSHVRIINSRTSHVSQIIELFAPIMGRITEHEAWPLATPDQVQSSVEEIKEELTNSDAPDTDTLEQHLINLGRMAPDILKLVLATISNPIIGLGVMAQMIATKASAEANAKG